jgi:hypothetical protein
MHGLAAQIVDDTTKMVYGPHTTKYTTERQLKNNVLNPYKNPDTTVYLMEKYDIVDRMDRRYQSLGFLGTPLFDLAYAPPVQIGRTFGFNGYDRYWKAADEIKYYDTKSPFMDVGVVLGGQRRSKIDVGFTRNVNPHWNVGFDINRITADKQIGGETIGDRSVESSSFDFYTNYQNDEKPYAIAFSVTRLKHQVADIGGVDVPDNPNRADYFQYSTADTQLQDARTVDLRSRFHVLHQYTLGSGFQLYHQADLTNQEYAFNDIGTGSDATKFQAYYPQFLIDNDTTNEFSKFRSFENEIGLKGSIKGAFYRFYARRRSLLYDYKQSLETTISETYVGTYLRFDWKEKFSVLGKGELSNEGAYLLDGSLTSDLVRLSYSSTRSLPAFMYQDYAGNHHAWSNNFDAVFHNYVSGSLFLKWKSISLEPKASLTAINNLIYFDDTQNPNQTSGTLLLNRIGGKIAFDFFRFNDHEHFRLETESSLTTVSGSDKDVVRLPQYMQTSRLFWRGDWFQNAVPVEIGTDLYVRTSYIANQYTPVLSQFYLQNDLANETYAAFDLFINMKIRNLRATIKWTHFNQQANDGYFATPYYPAQGAILDFGVQWLFFD